MAATLLRLVEEALQSARAGQLDVAERLWLEVLEREPRHTLALTSLGNYATERGETARAREYLEAARLTAPTDLHVLMDLGGARARAGDEDGELEAILWALAVDPEFPPALLLKAAWYERHGDPSSAYDAYSLAIENAADDSLWPSQYRREFAHARDFAAQYSRELNKHLVSKLDDALDRRAGPAAVRWREAASIRSGLTEPYTSTSSRLHVPRLPATPFFDRARFPFVDTLEAGASSIQRELLSLLDSENDSFEPCIAFRPDEPVGQWQPLNHSMRWSALHLWRKGNPVNGNLQRCPATSELLPGISLCDLSGFSPNAYFSLLAPRTHIPPHTGDTNARVIAQLPLIVPDRCGLRVGFETRDWRKGEMLFFDDTIEHEAFNDSDEPLALLVLDLWNPLLSDFDKNIVNALAQAAHGFESRKSVEQ